MPKQRALPLHQRRLARAQHLRTVFKNGKPTKADKSEVETLAGQYNVEPPRFWGGNLHEILAGDVCDAIKATINSLSTSVHA